MTQLAMDTLTAQLILDELCAKINGLTDYANTLHNRTWAPHASREQLLCETTAEAYRHTMSIVAKHTGIKIQWGKR